VKVFITTLHVLHRHHLLKSLSEFFGLLPLHFPLLVMESAFPRGSTSFFRKAMTSGGSLIGENPKLRVHRLAENLGGVDGGRTESVLFR
jgi:hypothetical protein